MASVTLYRIDQDKNMRRFYRIDVQKDLFGVWMLTREWGLIGRNGQKLIHSFQSELRPRKLCISISLGNNDEVTQNTTRYLELERVKLTVRYR